jgi:sRNA-binding carbon storage regulator CsrA
MLCFTRSINERVILTLPDGRTVTVCVVDILSRERCKLGFEAPRDVGIDRPEVAQAKALAGRR